MQSLIRIRLMVQRMATTVEAATDALESYDQAQALQIAEQSFWWFCDQYLELVKARRYDTADREAARSAQAALELALDVHLRLLALFLPFACEEAWSWWRDNSIHRASWPDARDLCDIASVGGAPRVDALDLAIDVLTAARTAKSKANSSMRTPIQRAVIADTAERLALLPIVEADIRAAAVIEHIETHAASAFTVDCDLSDR